MSIREIKEDPLTFFTSFLLRRWLSLTNVNLCIFEDWSNADLRRSNIRPDTLDKKMLRVNWGKNMVVSKFSPLCCGWSLIHKCWRDGQIQAQDGETSGIFQAYFRHISGNSDYNLFKSFEFGKNSLTFLEHDRCFCSLCVYGGNCCNLWNHVREYQSLDV